MLHKDLHRVEPLGSVLVPRLPAGANGSEAEDRSEDPSPAQPAERPGPAPRVYFTGDRRKVVHFIEEGDAVTSLRAVLSMDSSSCSTLHATRSTHVPPHEVPHSRSKAASF